jgi:hypothetical protein
VAGSILPGIFYGRTTSAEDLWISVRSQRTYPHVQSPAAVGRTSRCRTCPRSCPACVGYAFAAFVLRNAISRAASQYASAPLDPGS